MNKKAYTKPAVAVIEVKVESAFMQFSQTSGTGEGQNPGTNTPWEGEVETKGEGNFWDEW